MQSIRRAVPIAMLLASALLAAPAFAQSDADKATARELGQRGQAALDVKDYKKAEEAFRRADGLYHAPTLALGLARAQAAQGRFVEAWENYHRIIIEDVTSPPAFAKALEDAKAEIAQFEARRSQVTITVTGADSPHVKLDDVTVKSEALGISRFVDPGTHLVKASADGFKPMERSFTVGEGAAQSVSLVLERDANAVAAVAAGSAASPSATGTPGSPAGTDMAGPTSKPNHVPAIIAFGVGGVGLVLGAVTGGLALGKHSTLSNECPKGVCPQTSTSASSDLSSYHTMGAISTVGFIVAGAGAVAGAILWIAAPKGSVQAASAPWISPYVAPGSLGAVGRF